MIVEDVSGRSIAELWSLAGCRAVITGGGRGIGRAIAARFAEAGASIVIGDIDGELGRGTAAELAARHGGAVHSAAVDVSDSGSMIAFAPSEASCISRSTSACGSATGSIPFLKQLL